MSAVGRSYAAVMNTPTVSSNTVTVNRPIQTADGDILIAITTGPVATVTPPAGWVFMGSFTDTTVQSNMYKKIAASEGASYVFTWSVSSAVGCAVLSFYGGHDLLHWSAKTAGTANPGTSRQLDAARNAVGYSVYAWADTAAGTVTGSLGGEQYDVSAANTGSTVFRGLAGYLYGPPILNDIVNIGDALPATSFTLSTPPTGAVAWSILVGEKEPDAEPWSSVNGDFDVDLKLDTVAVDGTGSVTTEFKGDATGGVSAFFERGENAPTEVTENLTDGLASTKWLDFSATSYVTYDFGPGNGKTVKRYRLTSANDSPDRDPMNWTLEGSNDNSVFTVVDTRTNEAFASRGEVKEYRPAVTAVAYRYYKLNISANKSSGVTATIQLAELRLSTLDIWEEVTSYCVEEDKIRITRGLQDTSGRSDFTRAYINFRNTDGRFSPRNPLGAYHGAIQRNTQMRISKAYGAKSLQLQGDVQLEGTNMCGDGVRCPLTSALSIAGDIDIRVDLEPDSWRDEQMLAGIAVAEGGSEAWALFLDDHGILHLTWHDGTVFYDVSSEFAVPQAIRQAVRVTLDVNNGAGGHDLAFYTSDTISGSWTQLGSTITGAATTSVSYTGGALCVGHVGSRTQRGIHGLVYNFELRNGIAGPLVSDIDFTALANGSHAFSENSNEWVTVNNAVVSNRRYRFHGEVSEWPVSWEPTGRWVTAAATGAGVQKRLERGGSALSTMRRYHTKGIITGPGAFERFAEPAAYWPMEDQEGAFQLASGLPSKAGMQIYGMPLFNSDDAEAFNESDPLIRLNLAKFGGRVTGASPAFADVRWIHYSPVNMAAGAVVMEMLGTGIVRRWKITYEASNTWRIRGYDDDDTGVIFRDSGNQTITTNAEKMHIQIMLDYTSGSQVDVTMKAYDIYGVSLGSWTSTFAGSSVGRIYQINVNPNGDVGQSYIGHLALYGPDSPTFADGELNAHHYETALARIKRLCAEEMIEFRYSGSVADSALLGYQVTDTPFNLMSSAATSDDGYLTDPLDAFGVEYRTGRSLLNQTAHLTLSYTGGDLSGELRPVEDDSYITNDFTANRGGAGGARYQRSDGPLSIDAPPDGVGPYEDSQEYSLAHEGQCVDISSWQVHKGTLDEERYTKIEVALENLRVAASAPKSESILNLDVGKRVDITNTPDFLPAQDIRQIVIGYEEWFDKFQHNISLNTIPERAFETAQYDADNRFDTDDSVLYRDASASAVSLSVTTPTGQPWSTVAADFDAWIDGERVTVTAVADDGAVDTSDSFNRVDSTTVLGSTNGGVVQAWTQRSGTWGINGSAAYISAAATSVATVAGTADFEDLHVSVPTWASGEAFLVFRFTDTSNYMRWGGTVGAAATLITRSGGVDTATVTCEAAAWTLAAGDKLSARCHGSVIEVFRNDKLALTVTDTTNQSATLVGMRLATTAPRLDNFALDSASGPQVFTVTRGVNGVTLPHKAGSDVKLYQTPYRGL